MSRISVNRRGTATIIVLALLGSASLGLSACGSSSSGSSTSSTANAVATGTTTSTPTSTAPTTTTEGRAREVALIKALVGCMRQSGIKLPEPDASGQVNTHGINTNGAHYQAVLKRCLHKAQGH
ncbi:MAG: hypothetical protein ACHQE6_03370 [Solirubrobacterales bacterium]